MFSKLAAVALLCPLTGAQSAACLNTGEFTLETYVAVKNEIFKYIDELKECDGTVQAGCQERSDFLGGAVRLAFHDAATWGGVANPTQGGPDGCVNMLDHDNKGLADVMADSLTLRTRVATVVPAAASINLADWWVVVANAAAEAAGGASMGFRHGRVVQSSCNGTIGNLPDATRDYAHVQDIFKTRMGFTDREIVALMGAHALGRCEFQNSGFSGVWTRTPASLDNQFYIGLTVPWTKNKLYESNGVVLGGVGGKDQWNQGSYNNNPAWFTEANLENAQFFLNTDMSMIISNPDDPGCVKSDFYLADVPIDAGTCVKNLITGGFVAEYRTNNELFLGDFAAVYQKLQELSYTNLEVPCGVAHPDSPRDLVATPKATSYTLTWMLGADNGSPITDHTISYTVVKGGISTEETVSSGSGLPTFSLAGLEGATLSRISVQSSNAEGTSAYGRTNAVTGRKLEPLLGDKEGKNKDKDPWDVADAGERAVGIAILLIWLGLVAGLVFKQYLVHKQSQKQATQVPKDVEMDAKEQPAPEETTEADPV